MKVYYLKSTVHEDPTTGVQTRDEKRTDWSFGSNFCEKVDTDLPTIADLESDYDLVYSGDDISNLEDLFKAFQPEFMPPRISANVLEVGHRSHTSMSVGDIVVMDNGEALMCDTFGWLVLVEGN